MHSTTLDPIILEIREISGFCSVIKATVTRFDRYMASWRFLVKSKNLVSVLKNRQENDPNWLSNIEDATEIKNDLQEIITGFHVIIKKQQDKNIYKFFTKREIYLVGEFEDILENISFSADPELRELVVSVDKKLKQKHDV